MTNITYLIMRINNYVLRYEVQTYNPELNNLLIYTTKILKLLKSSKIEPKKLKRYCISWEWMEEHQYGDYVKYDDVVKLIRKGINK